MKAERAFASNLPEVGHRQDTSAMAAATPVYIVTPLQRSGINFLAELLRLDETLQAPGALWEDFILAHAHLLEDYLDATYMRWKRGRVEDPLALRRTLEGHLGEALFSFLSSQIDGGKRLLLKAPIADNVDKVFTFFPNARLVILVRDGRDVVESAFRKWPSRPREHWMRKWAQGVRTVLAFMRGPRAGDRGRAWELVRYEDLVRRLRPTLTDLLGFLGVEKRALDWDRAAHLPVFGSSWIPEEHGTNVVDKPAGFESIGRWKHWGPLRKWQFKRIAGRELIELGYASDNRW